MAQDVHKQNGKERNSRSDSKPEQHSNDPVSDAATSVDSKPPEHSSAPVGNAATSVQPIQPDNAFETGGKASLQKRVLGRNGEEIRGQGTAGPANLEIPAGQHATGSSTHTTGSSTHATASFTEVTKAGKLEVHRTGGMAAVKNPKDKNSA